MARADWGEKTALTPTNGNEHTNEPDTDEDPNDSGILPDQDFVSHLTHSLWGS